MQPNSELLETQNCLKFFAHRSNGLKICVLRKSISLIIIRSMADQSLPNGSPNYEANVSTNSGVVVVGPHTIIHHTPNDYSTPGI